MEAENILKLSHRETAQAGSFYSDKALLMLFLPLAIEQTLHIMVGLADSLIIADVGESAVSGVSLVNFIMSLLNYLLLAVSVGGSVVISQYIGHNDMDNARNTANQLVWAVGLFSTVLTLCVFMSKGWILDWLFGHIEPDVYSHADIYLSVTVFSLPFLSVYNAGAALFRTMNNTRLPMRIMIYMNILNIAGDILGVYVLDYGTVGIAVPTLVTRMGAAIIMICKALDNKNMVYILHSLRFRYDWWIVRKIMSVGVPFAFENGMFYGGRLVILSLIATFGTASIAANAVSGTLTLFQVMPGMAIVSGMTVVIARCIGADDLKQTVYYNRKIIAIVYIANAISSILVIAAMPMTLDIYGLSSEAESFTRQIIWLHTGFTILIWPLCYTLPTTFRAAGDARYPMCVSSLTMILFRIAGAYILGKYLGLGVVGVWLGMFGDWIAKAIMFVYRYYTMKWLGYRII